MIQCRLIFMFLCINWGEWTTKIKTTCFKRRCVFNSKTEYAIMSLSPPMLWARVPLRARGTTLCDKVCQWLAAGWLFSPGTPVSSTNKTDRYDITEILMKVALKTITITLNCNTTTIKQTNKQTNKQNHGWK